MSIAISLPFRRTQIFALSVVFLLLAASCSSSDTPNSVPSPTTTHERQASASTLVPPPEESTITQTTIAETPGETLTPANVSTIAAGYQHSCALRDGGKVSCWGDNKNGQLGSGQTSEELRSSSFPVAVVEIADAVSIATGGNFDGGHSCALHREGTISCWGGNWTGQLGNGTTDDSRVPVEVVGITDATAITAGYEHSCALHQTGTISCWGNNTDGQLGTGQTWDELADTAIPVEVSNISDAVAVDAGEDHSCALHQTGAVSCWGDNYDGQLGTGQTSEDLRESAIPIQVQGITGATDIATGFRYSCAIHLDGTVSCWGSNSTGELGSGQTYDELGESAIPIHVIGIFDAVAVDAGEGHSCALHQTGAISCWGNNGVGQLGNEQTTSEPGLIPANVAAINDAIEIAIGSGYSCAHHQSGGISCWGYNLWGQLGNGQSALRVSLLPVEVVGITDATAVALGYQHSCALHQDGTVSCWGGSNPGMALEATGASAAPVKIAGISGATNIATSRAHTCTVHRDGTISCWGINDLEILGGGQTNEDPEYSAGRVQVKGITDATAIATGFGHSCALHQTGTVSCWGGNTYGQLGNGTSGDGEFYDSANSAIPVNVTGITDAAAIATGFSHSCALHQTGSVSCWGEIGSGLRLTGIEQPDSELEYSSVPVKVVGVTDAIAIAAGREYSCALRMDGTVFCWQYISKGAQLGTIEAFRDTNIPVRVGEVTDAIDIASDGDSSCVLHQDGTVSCWGIETFFVFIAINEPLPVHMPDIDDAIAVDVSSDERFGNLGHACALHQGGKISCWGNNDYGQLGSEAPWSTVPTEVVGFGGQHISQATTVAVRDS